MTKFNYVIAAINGSRKVVYFDATCNSWCDDWRTVPALHKKLADLVIGRANQNRPLNCMSGPTIIPMDGLSANLSL